MSNRSVSSIGNSDGKVKCCDGWGPRTHEHEDPLMLHTRSRRKVESGKSGELVASYAYGRTREDEDEADYSRPLITAISCEALDGTI